MRRTGTTRAWMKKSEKKISKIVRGVKSEVKRFGKKWGLADTGKPDDGLGKKLPALPYTVVYISPFAVQIARGGTEWANATTLCNNRGLRCLAI